MKLEELTTEQLARLTETLENDEIRHYRWLDEQDKRKRLMDEHHKASMEHLNWLRVLVVVEIVLSVMGMAALTVYFARG